MKILFLTLVLFAVLIYTGCGSDSPSIAITVIAPTLTAPADNATGVPLTPTFKWSGEADKLQVSTNSGFTGSLNIDATVSGTEYTPPNSLARGVYFWRAGKTSGGTVYWSTVFKFTTI